MSVKRIFRSVAVFFLVGALGFLLYAGYCRMSGASCLPFSLFSEQGHLRNGLTFRFLRYPPPVSVLDPSCGIRLAGTVVRAKGREKGRVLLLHGSSAYGRKLPMYRVLSDRLATDGYTVAAFDFRGYNESDDPGQMRFEHFNWLKDVALIRRYLRWEAFHLIGHSLGGSVALNHAAQTGGKGLLSVVSIGPTRQVYQRLLRPGAPDFYYACSRLKSDMALSRDIPPRLARQLLNVLNMDNALDYFHRPDHCPLLLVDNARDRPKDMDYTKHYFGAVTSKKKYVTVPDSGHYLDMRSLFTSRMPNPRPQWDVVVYNPKEFDTFYLPIRQWIDGHNPNGHSADTQ